MISFNLFQQGAIHIHSAIFLHLSENAFLLSLDCKQKYPDAEILWSDEFKGDEKYESEPGSLSVCVLPDEQTLHVPKNAKREEDGSYKMTILEVKGFEGEDWMVTHERGKWGPYIYGIRRVKNPSAQPWPDYTCDASECPDDE